MKIRGLLLAAGNGSRLGRGPKALLPFRGGMILDHVAGALHEGGCEDVLVVLGAEAERVSAQCTLERCSVVLNPLWATGLASSFRTGIGAAAGADALMVALVDQPNISAPLVKTLIQAHVSGAITAATYSGSGRASHPMIFDLTHARRAAELAQGDYGARAYLKLHPDSITLVDCSSFGTDADIDTPDQLHLLDDHQ